jgi:hypothetical protein
MKKQKKQTPKYQIERIGAAEYVVVSCPNGHVNRGQKVGDMELRVELVCGVPRCSQPWTQTIPAIMHLEAES